MVEPGGLSAVRRLLGAEVRPWRALRWFTTRRIMAIVAILAVGIAVDLMRRKRDWCLAQGVLHRAAEKQSREMAELTGSSLPYLRRSIAHWVEENEAIGAGEVAATCRAVLAATDGLIAERRGGMYRETELAKYRDDVARLTANLVGDWKPSKFEGIADRFDQRSFAKLNFWASNSVALQAMTLLRLEHHARLGAKYERAASHPWESVEPDPPRPY